MNTSYAVTLSLVSSKGGVGKSTWAINGACAFADMGLRVLCVDLDPQQSLSKFFCPPQDIRNGSGLYEFLNFGRFVRHPADTFQRRLGHRQQ